MKSIPLKTVIALATLIFSSQSFAQLTNKSAWAQTDCDDNVFPASESVITVGCTFRLQDAFEFPSTGDAVVYDLLSGIDESVSYYAVSWPPPDPVTTTRKIEGGFVAFWDGQQDNSFIKVEHYINCTNELALGTVIGYQNLRRHYGSVINFLTAQQYDGGIGLIAPKATCGYTRPNGPRADLYQDDQFNIDDEIDWTWYPGPACGGAPLNGLSATALASQLWGTGVSVSTGGECHDMNDAVDLYNQMPQNQEQPTYRVWWFPSCIGVYQSYPTWSLAVNSGGISFRFGVGNNESSYGSCTWLPGGSLDP